MPEGENLHVIHMKGYEQPPPDPTPVSVWTMQAAEEQQKKAGKKKSAATKSETEKST